MSGPRWPIIAYGKVRRPGPQQALAAYFGPHSVPQFIPDLGEGMMAWQLNY